MFSCELFSCGELSLDVSQRSCAASCSPALALSILNRSVKHERIGNVSSVLRKTAKQVGVSSMNALVMTERSDIMRGITGQSFQLLFVLSVGICMLIVTVVPAILAASPYSQREKLGSFAGLGWSE